MTKVTDPGQISKNWSTSKKMGTTRILFYPKTSYLVSRYNPIRRIQSKRGPSVKVKSQGQNFPKMGKSPNNLPYLRCYFPTDFILDTKIPPKKAHLMTQVPMTWTFIQGQRSRLKFPQNG